jgi:hypothetical protein
MVSAPLVVAQVIETIWSKRARGGALATLRSRVPERLLLPAWKHAPEVVCVVHYGLHDERNSFAAGTAESIVQHHAFPVTLCGCVELHVADPLLRVIFGGQYSLESEPGTLFGYSRMGAPRRTITHEPITLTAGTWGQIRYCGRFAYEDVVYKRYTCNIAWQITPERDMFLTTQPRQRFASLPRLW